MNTAVCHRYRWPVVLKVGAGPSPSSVLLYPVKTIKEVVEADAMENGRDIKATQFLADAISEGKRASKLGDTSHVNDIVGRIKHYMAQSRIDRVQSDRILKALDGFVMLADQIVRTRDLLARAELQAIDGPVSRDTLKDLTDAVKVAMTLGADDAFEKFMIAGVQRIMDAAREASDRHSVLDEHPLRRRRATRHILPRLTIKIDEKLYKTIDWSSRGLLIGGIQGSFEAGSVVNLYISCDDVMGGGLASASVIRFNRASCELALLLKQPASALLILKARMLTSGLTLMSAPIAKS